MIEAAFFLVTLGCKVNQYETQALREAWQALGLRETDHPAEAGIMLINSCAVTAKAVADVRATARRLHRANPAGRIIITGCAAEVLTDELSALPGVAAVVGQKAKASLLRAVPAPRPGGLIEVAGAKTTFDPIVASGRESDPTPGPAPGPATDLDMGLNLGRERGIPLPGEENRPSWTGKGAAWPPFAVSTSDRSRAVLKIQDGCSHGCAYCIVPLTRGPALSRPVEEAIREARRLLAAGFREIMISGVNLRQFTDRESDPGSGDQNGFWRFLARLDRVLAPEWAGAARFRISSLEPGQLGDEALETLAASRLIAPHLHLSLQSGSQNVLRRMGRGHYDPDLLPAWLERLGRIWPLYGLGADLLTGFPAESEEEFRHGLDLCASLPLSYAHVFPYSRRPGTRAASMPGQVDPETKKARAAALRAMVGQKQTAFLNKIANLPQVRVVFEQDPKKDGLHAINEYYVECLLPGDGASVAARSISAQSMAAGSLVPARPVGIKDGKLVVTVEEGR